MSVILELVACIVLEERTDVLHDATVGLVQGDVRFGRNGMLVKADGNVDIFVGTHDEETSLNGGGLVWAMKVGEAKLCWCSKWVRRSYVGVPRSHQLRRVRKQRN